MASQHVKNGTGGWVGGSGPRKGSLPALSRGDPTGPHTTLQVSPASVLFTRPLPKACHLSLCATGEQRLARQRTP